MVQKARLLFSITIICLCFVNCKDNNEEAIKTSSLIVDATKIPNDTIAVDDKNLILENGVYYLKLASFSGYIIEKYPNAEPKSIVSYLKGKKHGFSSSYYLNGKLNDKRSYKNGKSFGKQIGFWENGKQKFEFIYINDKREGLQKQWYESGKPYAFLTFKDDKEDGMQQAWRENGKSYINYEAKDGKRYGLQKSNLCYTLINEKLKQNENK